MEYNIEKKCIGISQIIKEELQEQPLEAEWNLPDYCSDIERILKCRGEARISSRRVTGRTAYVEGYTAITVIYADSEKRLCSYDQAIPFYREISLDSDNVNHIEVEGVMDYLNVRATSPKRIEVKGAVGLKISIISLLSADVITNADGCGLELDKRHRNLTSTIGTFEKYMTVSDEVEIGEGAIPIRSIISGKAVVCDTDVNPITNKTIVKGNVKVKILYCTKNGSATTMEATIPFNQIVDTEGVDELCKCSLKTQVTSLDLRARTGVDGESRSVGITVGLLLTVRAEENVECDVALNAYSTKYKTELVPCEQRMYCFKDNVRKRITVTEEVELSLPASQIFDVWCDRNNAFIQKDGVLSINGSSVISILFEDKEGNPVYIEKDLAYNYKSEVIITPNAHCQNALSVQDVGYTLLSDTTAEIRMVIEIDASVYEPLDSNILSGIILDENSPKLRDKNRSPIIVYYPSSGETLFEIAARYNTSVAEVRMANDIEDDDTIGNVLLIPIQN